MLRESCLGLALAAHGTPARLDCLCSARLADPLLEDYVHHRRGEAILSEPMATASAAIGGAMRQVPLHASFAMRIRLVPPFHRRELWHPLSLHSLSPLVG